MMAVDRGGCGCGHGDGGGSGVLLQMTCAVPAGSVLMVVYV